MSRVGTIVGGPLGGVVGGVSASLAAKKATDVIADSLDYNIKILFCETCKKLYKCRVYADEIRNLCYNCR